MIWCDRLVRTPDNDDTELCCDGECVYEDPGDRSPRTDLEVQERSEATRRGVPLTDLWRLTDATLTNDLTWVFVDKAPG